MKGAFLLIAVALIIKLSRGEIMSSSSFGQAFSAQGQKNLPDRIAGQFSNFTVEWDPHSGFKFFVRQQEQCVDPGYGMRLRERRTDQLAIFIEHAKILFSPALQKLAAAQLETTVFPEVAARLASRGVAVANATILRLLNAAQTDPGPVRSITTVLWGDVVQPGSCPAEAANASIQRRIDAARAAAKSGPVRHQNRAVAWGFVSTLPHSNVAKKAHVPRKIVVVQMSAASR
ncbi:hypothetical protein FGG08_006862 [Glutinoglossum americanum]|uniref:Uncharacterized protein n=1 Tax=Glutinoglossum americanum TaxID=1670608 RepID=A0A9P8L1H2_9PEZI|nr:hypothetical protein FGG08_006862 [Glutinoglossum americanum]